MFVCTLPYRALLIACVVGGLAGCGGSGTEPDTTPEVRIVDNAFSPRDLTVATGTTLRWTNEGSAIHDVTSYEGVFVSEGLAPGHSFSHHFTEPGYFEYACARHPGMRGSITVD